jgi:hypothetical protein
MKSQYLLIINIILILTIFILSYALSNKNKQQRFLEYEIEKITNEKINMVSVFSENRKSEFKIRLLNEVNQIEILNMNGDSMKIGDLMNNKVKSKIIILPSESCDLCYDDFFSSVESFAQVEENVRINLIISADRLIEIVSKIKSTKSSNIEFFTVKDSDLEQYKIPGFSPTVLSCGEYDFDVFIPNSNLNEITKSYFNQN